MTVEVKHDLVTRLNGGQGLDKIEAGAPLVKIIEEYPCKTWPWERVTFLG